MITNLLISYVIILAVVGVVYGVLNHKKVLNDTQIQYLYASEKAYKKINIPAKLAVKFVKTIVKLIIKLMKFMLYKRAMKQMFNV